MKIKITRGRGIAYISKDIREAGYIGDVNLTPDAFAIVMEKPGTTPKDILVSLDILRRHYKALAEAEEKVE